MSNVTECIDLYLSDTEVSDAMFRRVIRDAAERDATEHEARLTYWRNLGEARKEREAQGAA